MGARYASLIIGSLEMDKARMKKLSGYLDEHYTGFLADFRDYPIAVEIFGNKAVVFYTRIAEVDAEQFMRLISGGES